MFSRALGSFGWAQGLERHGGCISSSSGESKGNQIMESKSKQKRWAAAGLVVGMMLGGGALANAASNSGSSAPMPIVVSQPAAPSVQAEAPSTPEVAPVAAPAADTPEASDVQDAPGAVDTPEANDVPDAKEAPGTEVSDANEVEGASEVVGAKEAAEANEDSNANEATEANNGGVDCENGIVKGASTQCDGGPSANVDNGTESGKAAE
jgi:hypothetical protein